MKELCKSEAKIKTLEKEHENLKKIEKNCEIRQKFFF